MSGWAGLVAQGASDTSNLLGMAANIQATKEANRRNEDDQKLFAQAGLRWKVADAEAAGIHPLYALGGAGSTFSPSFQAPDLSGFSRMGQNLERAIQPSETEEQRAAQWLDLKYKSSMIEETDARKGYYDSLAAKARQDMLNSSPWPNGNPAATIVPDKQIATAPDDKARTAGRHPAFKSWTLGDLFGQPIRIDAPWSDEGLGESVEGLGALALTLYRNAIHRPLEWKNRVKNKYFPYDPSIREVIENFKRKGGD